MPKTNLASKIKSILLATTLLLSSISFAAPNCTWIKSNIESKLISDDRIVIDSYRCEIENYDTSDEPETKSVIILRPNKIQIEIESSNSYIGIELLETDKEMLLHALKFSRPGASNVGNSVRVYDMNWVHATTLNSPVNEYQTTNRKGSESRIMGFFKVDNEWHIENVRSLGGECNACMQYVIDTYKVVGSELVVIDTRDFDINDYERYENKNLKPKDKL